MRISFDSSVLVAVFLLLFRARICILVTYLVESKGFRVYLKLLGVSKIEFIGFWCEDVEISVLGRPKVRFARFQLILLYL